MLLTHQAPRRFIAVDVSRRRDPTGTTTIRGRYQRDMERRFRRVRLAIMRAVGTDDVLDLGTSVTRLAKDETSILPPKAFAYMRRPDKVSAFMSWLRTAEDANILSVMPGTPMQAAANTSWQNTYIDSAYQKGIRDAGKKLGARAATGQLIGQFNAPIHADAVGLIYTRAYTGLKGITEAMDTQISRILAQGMIEGRGPMDVARRLAERVDGIGIVRARALVRTELVSAHAEASLNMYEEAGIAGVELDVEFSTAGDDAVCFPAYTLVRTINGDKSIQDIRIGDLVLTRVGYRVVKSTGQRRYSGKLVRVNVNGASFVCTADHPVWCERGGFVRADSLYCGDRLQLANNQRVNVLGVHDLGFGDANDRPSGFFKRAVASLIFFFRERMPVGTVNFKRNTADSKVNDVRANLQFLNERNLQAFQCQTCDGFNTSLASEFSVASHRAESAIVAGRHANSLFATQTLDKVSWSPAFFGAVNAVKATFNVVRFMRENLAATWTRFLDVFHVGSFAFHRAEAVAFCVSVVDGKRCSAPNADFSNDGCLLSGVIADARTERATFASRQEYAGTMLAWCQSSGAFSSHPASTGTIPNSAASFFNRLATQFKFSFARVASEAKRHVCLVVCLGLLRAQKIVGTRPFVYNLSVEDKPEFFANGVLVHNCEECAALEGQVYSIEESRGIIPIHVNCRCAWLPANIG